MDKEAMTPPSPALQAALKWINESCRCECPCSKPCQCEAPFLAGYALAIEQSAKEDVFLKVIREWKWHWRTEQPGYEDRPAHQPDANMAHDLARRLCDSIRALMPESCAKMEDEK